MNWYRKENYPFTNVRRVEAIFSLFGFFSGILAESAVLALPGLLSCLGLNHDLSSELLLSISKTSG